MKKNILAVICALCCAVGAIGLSACKNVEHLSEPDEHTIVRDGIEYEWSETERGLFVSAAEPTITTAAIPAAVDGFPVRGVSPSAFRRCEALTSVSVSKGVTEIGADAFEDCSALEKIDLPENITKIGHHAFYNTAFWKNRENWDGEVLYLGGYLLRAGNLEGEYTIKDGTKLIADEAFNFYYDGYPVDAADPIWSGGCVIVSRPTDLFTGVVIPEGVTHIGSYAFSSRWKLEKIVLPQSVISIGTSAFANTAYTQNKENWENDALYLGHCLLNTEKYISGEYVIKDGTKIIAEKAFYNRKQLGAVRFPNGLKTIGDYAFYECPNLDMPALPKGLETIGAHAFSNCPKFEKITLPNGLKTIGEYAFYGCPLQFVTIPKTVQSIGKRAFRFENEYAEIYLSDIRMWCTASSSFAEIAHDTTLYLYLNGKPLTDLVIPKGVTTVRNFENCELLVSVRFSNDVVKIDDWAFRNCKFLRKVTLPSSLKSIGKRAFDGCATLKSVKIPKSVTQIGDYAFNGCSTLQTIELPSNLTELGKGAFSDCAALESITLPSSLTKIEDSTFSQCTALKEIIIPDGVTSIGSYAFRCCSALTSITIPEGVTTIENATFCGCSALTSITIPEGITTIESYTFYGCRALTNVSLPRTVTEINLQSFGNCTSLTNLTYKGTLEEWNNVSRGWRWKHDSGIARVTCTDYYIEI